MRDCSSASDITDIICLSQGVPVGRTPLKQLVRKKACNFKRFPLLLHPVESSLVPISLIYALFKTHQRFEVQVNKSSKTSFQTLGNSIIFWRNEAVVWTTETHDPRLLLRVVRWNTRWVGLISFSISSIMFIESVLGGGRDQDQAQDRAEERQTEEKSALHWYRCAC